MTLNWGMREEQKVNDDRERLLGDAPGRGSRKKICPPGDTRIGRWVAAYPALQAHMASKQACAAVGQNPLMKANTSSALE
jgi:hypothetical protein